MLRILLVCSGGMSTSFLAKRIQDVADKKGVKAKVSAVGDSANIIAIGDSDSFIASKKADIVLLAPQVRYLEKNMKDRVHNLIPVSVIDMSAYGMMNGEIVLRDALKTIEEFNLKTINKD